jgi:signal transduction histidine kinase
MAETEDARALLAAERSRAAQQLREAEERYQALLDRCRQRELQGRELQRLRREVWRMRRVEDIAQVLVPIGAILSARGISFLAYAINLVSTAGERASVQVFIHDPEGKQFLAELELDKAESRIILEAWRTGQVLYRPDLERENPYGEHLVPRSPQQRVRAAIDVPFSRGTLALASARPGAFSGEDIAFFQDIAQVVEEGFQRLEDLQQLESRRQEAELDLALQRVRNAVLQMEGEEDWGKIVNAFQEALRRVVDFEGSSVNIVDQQSGTTTVYYLDPGGVLGQLTSPTKPALRQAMETERYVYRRNREEILRLKGQMAPQIQSVLDVPFRGGTVAVNSTREDAFGPRDILILERFAQVMSEAHQRLEDLRALGLREEQLRQAQKLEAVGQLAAGVSHELNNPLTSVLGYSELLLRKPELDPQVRQHLETIQQEGERAREIAARLLQFVRRQKAPRQPVDLNVLARESLELVRRQFELDHVELRAELAPDLPRVQVQPGPVQQVILSLLQNSREAILGAGKGGVVKVRSTDQGERVRLEVEDDGPGIPPEIRARIFEPFFTTKGVGRGPGLGLSICHAIARDQGGWLWVAPSELGACLVLELPVEAAAGQ